MAVLIPISSPFEFTSAPPELPGFTAASVCINDSMEDKLVIGSLSNMLISLPFAETIPAVTVDVKLNGLPTAKTHSPTFKSSEFP